MSILNMNGATLIPSVEEENKTYLELNGIRYIFQDGKYIGWYDPELGRVL